MIVFDTKISLIFGSRTFLILPPLRGKFSSPPAGHHFGRLVSQALTPGNSTVIFDMASSGNRSFWKLPHYSELALPFNTYQFSARYQSKVPRMVSCQRISSPNRRSRFRSPYFPLPHLARSVAHPILEWSDR